MAGWVPSGGRPTPETADLETVITDLMSGQYKDPVRIVAFINTVERWSEHVNKFRRTWPMKCVGAVICSCDKFRQEVRTLSNVTKAIRYSN